MYTQKPTIFPLRGAVGPDDDPHPPDKMPPQRCLKPRRRWGFFCLTCRSFARHRTMDRRSRSWHCEHDIRRAARCWRACCRVSSGKQLDSSRERRAICFRPEHAAGSEVDSSRSKQTVANQGEVVAGLGLRPVGKEALRVKPSITQFHTCPRTSNFLPRRKHDPCPSIGFVAPKTGWPNIGGLWQGGHVAAIVSLPPVRHNFGKRQISERVGAAARNYFRDGDHLCERHDRRQKLSRPRRDGVAF
jgi:hypothetical protein